MTFSAHVDFEPPLRRQIIIVGHVFDGKLRIYIKFCIGIEELKLKNCSFEGSYSSLQNHFCCVFDVKPVKTREIVKTHFSIMGHK